MTREEHLEATRRTFVVALNMGVTEARIQKGTTLADIAASMKWDVAKLDEALSYPSNMSLEQIAHVCVALAIDVKFSFEDIAPVEVAAE